MGFWRCSVTHKSFLGNVILNELNAGWSSLVARRAHNPKVVGSNPAPATTFRRRSPARRKGLPESPSSNLQNPYLITNL